MEVASITFFKNVKPNSWGIMVTEQNNLDNVKKKNYITDKHQDTVGGKTEANVRMRISSSFVRS